MITVEELSATDFQKRKQSIQVLPKRVSVLLAAEWARSVLSVFEDKYPTDKRPRLAIEAAENYSAGAAIAARVAAADAYAAAAAAYASYDAYAAAAAAYAAYAAYAYAYAAGAYASYDAGAYDVGAYAAYAAGAAGAAGGTQKKWNFIQKTFRATKGSGIVFNLEWRSSTVVALAKEIRSSRDFSLMPILADALQDAGCDNIDLMIHLQSNEEFTVADWAIWNALDYGTDFVK